MASQPFDLTVADHWTDSRSVYDLWMRTLGDRWPIRESVLTATFHAPIVNQKAVFFAAHQVDRLIGFLCIQVNSIGSAYQTGYIHYLLVDPDWQRQGIGRQLIDAAADHLRATGSIRMNTGGRYPRIWPGIPENLPDASAFFEAIGFPVAHEDYDLGQWLHDYRTPDAVTARIAAEGVIIEPANPNDSAEVQSFQDREFAGWADTYRYVIGVGDVRDVLVARDPAKAIGEQIIGSLIMYTPDSHADRIDADWRDIHGESIGGLGEVGVTADERKRGLGLALVARGSEILQARGVAFAHIGYTSLVDFYAKLGYQPWQKYQIGIKSLK